MASLNTFVGFCIILGIVQHVIVVSSLDCTIAFSQEEPYLDRQVAATTDTGYAEHKCVFTVPENDLLSLRWTIIDGVTPTEIYKYQNGAGEVLDGSLIERVVENDIGSTGGKSKIKVLETLENRFTIKCTVFTSNNGDECSEEHSTQFVTPSIKVLINDTELTLSGGYCDMSNFADWNNNDATLQAEAQYLRSIDGSQQDLTMNLVITGGDTPVTFDTVTTTYTGSHWKISTDVGTTQLVQGYTLTSTVADDITGSGGYTASCTLPALTCNAPSADEIEFIDGDFSNKYKDDVVTVRCHTGYEIVDGGETVTCNIDQTFTELPTCEKVKCTVPEIENAKPIGDDEVLYEKEVVVECKEGYQIKGNSLITCGSDKSFGTSLPTCTNTSVTEVTGVTEGGCGAGCGVGIAVGIIIPLAVIIGVVLYLDVKGIKTYLSKKIGRNS